MKILFFGTPAFAVAGLRALADEKQVEIVGVVTQPDRASGRGQRLTPSPVKTFALERGLNVLQPTSIRKEASQFLNQLRSLGAIDIGVVIAFGQILPAELLCLPRHGCVNVHASLLPRWRGAAPIQRAIMAGDTETGVCIMQMDTTLDTGPVFARQSLTLLPDETAGTLHDRLAEIGAPLLVRTLPQIVHGSLQAHPQPSAGVTYAQKITNDEACLRWSCPAPELERTIRGLSPAPGAFTTLKGLRLKIFGARALPHRIGSSTPPPGTISLADGATLEVSCGSGCLALTDLQLAGKRRMSAAEFLRGGILQQGDTFEG